jgi:hypothetical protein
MRPAMLSLAAMASLALAAAMAQQPGSNLDYWLSGSTTSPASEPASMATKTIGPFAEPRRAATETAPPEAMSRDDALPAVVETSDGRATAGRLFGTRGRPLEVYVDADRLWRRVPLEAVLSITAVVEEEQLELEWRWKAMGVPEKEFTGRSYPTRRLSWRLLLADGTTLTGAIKGQPLWLDTPDERLGPFVLQERSKGAIGQSLADLVYVRRIIVSHRLAQQLSAS